MDSAPVNWPSSPKKLKKARWRWRLVLVLAALGILAEGAHAAVARWAPDELGPELSSELEEPPGPLGPGDLRVVTLNAWRLASSARVPALLGAVDEIGVELGAPARLVEDERRHPELVAIQEIQSREAIADIEEQLGGEGVHVTSCICSLRPDGSVREAVVAVSRPPVVATEGACLELGSIFPDHSRCAALIRGEIDGRPIDFVSTHLAWSLDNAPMVQTLARELAARGALGPGTIVAGDLNAAPGSDAYRALLATGLRDARPGSARTHFVGGRIDYVLVGDELEVIRGIDRRASYDIVQPVARFTLPSECASEGPPGCGISDHLPEAVVLRAR